MNKRIKKKKYNKWAFHHNDQEIRLDQMVNDAARYKGIKIFIPVTNERSDLIAQKVSDDFIKFTNSKDVMRAVKLYIKNQGISNHCECRNIDDMYRYMCEEIHNEREYQKRIEEQKRMQRKYDDSIILAPVTDERIQSMMAQGNWRGSLEHPTTRSDMTQSYR